MKLLILALCVVSATAFRPRCHSAADCEEDECCVNYAIVNWFGGHCQKIRQEGESCTPLLRESKENPDMHHFQCPCRDGLTCEPTHQIKIGDVVVRYKPQCVVPGEATTVIEEFTGEIIDEVTEDGGEIGEPEAE